MHPFEFRCRNFYNTMMPQVIWSHGAGMRDAHSDAVRDWNVRASDGLTRLVLSDLTQVNAFSCSKCPPAPALFCVVFTPPTLH